MDIKSQLLERARLANRRLAFPEGDDPRVITAAYDIESRKLGWPVLLADPASFDRVRRELGFAEAAFDVVDPSRDLDHWQAVYHKVRGAKVPKPGEAEAAASDTLFRAAMMVAEGDVDACVGGAVRTTADTVRAALKCIGPKGKTVSSFFLMILPPGDRALLYTDCGVIPFPDAYQLAEIARAGAHSWRQLMADEPHIAKLSFSTYGSAEHESIDTIRQALAILKREDPSLKVDGDLQADAALVPHVGAAKAPGSPVAGKANVLVFPNLHAGNIAYKLTERLAGATALGPILQGLKKPMNDLSRGCSAEDVVLVAAISAIQCE